jgi:hypothetical protein
MLVSKRSEFLLLIIKFEIIEELCSRSKSMEYAEHFLSNFRVDFLAVSTLASRSVFVQRVLNMNELSVWNIFDLHPLNIDRSWPFSVLFPKVLVLLLVVDFADHLCSSTEVLGLVHAEE